MLSFCFVIRQNSLAVYVNSDGVLDVNLIKGLMKTSRHYRGRGCRNTNRCGQERHNENVRRRQTFLASNHCDGSNDLQSTDHPTFLRVAEQKENETGASSGPSHEGWQFISNSTKKQNSVSLLHNKCSSSNMSSTLMPTRSPFPSFTQFSCCPSRSPSLNREDTHHAYSLPRASNDKSMLLCFPLTLGGGPSLNNIYHSSICRYFELPWFVGAIGAKAGKKQAFYFVGKHEQKVAHVAATSIGKNSRYPLCWPSDQTRHRRSSSCDAHRHKSTLTSIRSRSRISQQIRLPSSKSFSSNSVPSFSNTSQSPFISTVTDAVELLYLDPHIVQPRAVDVTVDWNSFHRPKLFRLSPRYLDPGLLMAFYCEDTEALIALALKLECIAREDRHAPLIASHSTISRSDSVTSENKVWQIENTLVGLSKSQATVQEGQVSRQGSSQPPSVKEIPWHSNRSRRCRRSATQQSFRSVLPLNNNAGAPIHGAIDLAMSWLPSEVPDNINGCGNNNSANNFNCKSRSTTAGITLWERNSIRIRERHNADGFVELSASDSPRSKLEDFVRTEDSTTYDRHDVDCSDGEVVLTEQICGDDCAVDGSVCGYDDCASPSPSFLVLEEPNQSAPDEIQNGPGALPSSINGTMERSK